MIYFGEVWFGNPDEVIPLAPLAPCSASYFGGIWFGERTQQCGAAPLLIFPPRGVGWPTQLDPGWVREPLNTPAGAFVKGNTITLSF